MEVGDYPPHQALSYPPRPHQTSNILSVQISEYVDQLLPLQNSLRVLRLEFYKSAHSQ